MKRSDWQRLAAVSGLVFVLLQIAIVLLFFIGGQPPSISDSAGITDYIAKNQTALLTTGWLGGLATVFILIWLTGVRSVIRSAGEDWEAAAVLFFGTGIVTAATALVAGGIVAGAVVDTTTRAEPAAVKGLFEAGGLIFGTVLWFPVALMAALAAFVTTRTGVLPSWTAWVGYAAAVLNLVTTGSIYGGGEPGGFYTATGLVGIVLGLLPFLIWIACLSAVMLRMPGATGARQRVAASS
jgi:hypothetical protein